MAENLLSDLALRKLKARDSEIRLNDGGGLYVRVLPGAGRKPRIVFQYRFKLNGKAGYYQCGGEYPKTSLSEAREDRDKARKLVRQGIHPGIEDKRLRAEREAREQAAQLEKTVQGLHEDWQRVYLSQHRKDGGALVRQFVEADVLPYLGKIKAKGVTRSHIVQVIDRIADRGSRRKANAVLSMLKQMFRHGLARGIVDIDPSAALQKKHAGGKETPRNRALCETEITALSRALPNAKLPLPIEAAVWLLLATGARVGELVKAKWSEFDLEERTWTIPAERSKNGKAHLVHLSAFALGWLAKLAERREGAQVFPGRKPGEPLSEKWIGKCARDRQRVIRLRGRTKQTGVLRLAGGEWRMHDLRRTMATRMGDLGVAPYVIEKCLNHSLGGILAVYQHQEYLPERKAAFEQWGARLNLLANAELSNVRPLIRKAG